RPGEQTRPLAGHEYGVGRRERDRATASHPHEAAGAEGDPAAAVDLRSAHQFQEGCLNDDVPPMAITAGLCTDAPAIREGEVRRDHRNAPGVARPKGLTEHAALIPRAVASADQERLCGGDGHLAPVARASDHRPCRIYRTTGAPDARPT